ncbi:MAG: flagellar biosynthesis anti-sigma factor FlgM [Thermoguttaceae bacterium]|nr:flagellar biosynthesis anti-sigma factor FlgM [Thermoguttaceae bacterium]MDW8077266.1 flagellar biosynthesis anti-sigma factor FlgM [Thermoguttaceae bacterium]
MQVFGPGSIHGPQGIGGPHLPRGVQQPRPASPPIQDELHLSEAAQRLADIQDSQQIRWDRVRQIRAEIAAGTYETPEKLEIALRRLLERLQNS